MNKEITRQQAFFFNSFSQRVLEFETLFLKGCRDSIDAELIDFADKSQEKKFKDDLDKRIKNDEFIERKELLPFYQEYSPLFSESEGDDLTMSVRKKAKAASSFLQELDKDDLDVLLDFLKYREVFWEISLVYMGKYYKNIEAKRKPIKKIETSFKTFYKNILRFIKLGKEFRKVKNVKIRKNSFRNR